MTVWRAGRYNGHWFCRAMPKPTSTTCCRDIFPCRLVGRKGATPPVTYTAHTTTLDLAQHR